MKSNFYIAKTICTISIDPNDMELITFDIEMMEIVNKNQITDVIVDVKQLQIITSETIKFLDKIVNILKLNNIETIVCGFNVESASILFHFIDEIKFNTTLNVESALDAIKHK